MTALSLSSLRNGQVYHTDGSPLCYMRVVLSRFFFSVGNVSRYSPGREPSRPRRVDQCGTVQLGAVSGARHLIPSGDFLPLQRRPSSA